MELTTQNIFYWATRLIAAVILLQTLFFKFTAADESVYIFTAVGMEPWGRIGIGVMELIAAVLLLINATAWLGGVIAFALMLGAIAMHLTLLGVSVKDDGGYLFFLAVVVALCSLYVLFRNKDRLFLFLETFRK